MLREIVIELDRAAKSLTLHDVDTAALCFRKAVEGHVAMAPPEPTPDPSETDAVAEFTKAVNAFEIKNFSLAALCLEKATEGVAGRIPGETVTHLKGLSRAIRSENFSSMAVSIRDGLTSLVGDTVIEPVTIPGNESR